MKFESEQNFNTILPVLSICSERFSAYQNTAALFGKPQQDVVATPSSSLTSELGSSNTLQHPERKKPVPLPRSKIPVSQQSQSQSQTQTQSQTSTQQQPKKQPSAAASLHARFFSKRAKTDLGFDGLAAYKAGKRPPGGTKYSAPKVPTFNRPVPQQRQQQPSQSQSQMTQSQSQPRFNLPQKQQQKEAASSNKASKKPEAKIKPEIKEKPLFSTFKQREQNDSFRCVIGDSQ